MEIIYYQCASRQNFLSKPRCSNLTFNAHVRCSILILMNVHLLVTSDGLLIVVRGGEQRTVFIALDTDPRFKQLWDANF